MSPDLFRLSTFQFTNQIYLDSFDYPEVPGNTGSRSAIRCYGSDQVKNVLIQENSPKQQQQQQQQQDEPPEANNKK